MATSRQTVTPPISASASPIVVDNSDVDGIDVTLPTALHITGTVTRADGTAVGGVNVQAFDVTTGWVSTSTADDGTYSLVVAPGTYIVQFSDNTDGTNIYGYYSTDGFAYLEELASPVMVDTTDVAGIDVALPNLVHIAGTVTRTGGTPLAGVSVQADGVDGGPGASASTADDGTYSLAVAPGAYIITFSDSTDGADIRGYYSTGGSHLRRGRRIARRCGTMPTSPASTSSCRPSPTSPAR